MLTIRFTERHSTGSRALVHSTYNQRVIVNSITCSDISMCTEWWSYEPAPVGVFMDPARRWGWGCGVGTPPVRSVKLKDRFSIRKQDLTSPGTNFPNMLRKFIWRSLMTSQLRPNIRYLLSVIAGIVGQSSCIELKQSGWKTLIVSVILFSALLSFWWPRVTSRSSEVTR